MKVFPGNAKAMRQKKHIFVQIFVGLIYLLSMFTRERFSVGIPLEKKKTRMTSGEEVKENSVPQQSE